MKSRFKVGDRVRTTPNVPYGPVGAEGVVTRLTFNYTQVLFDNPDLRHIEVMSFLDDEIELCTAGEFREGDRVVLIGGGANADLLGKHGTVVKSQFSGLEGGNLVGVTLDHDSGNYHVVSDGYLVFEGEKVKTFTGYRTGDISDTHTSDQMNDPREPQYYGAVFPNGRTIVSWNTTVKSVSVFDSFDEFEKIHGHYDDGYGTFISWGNGEQG
jgi:hypothetical protein